MSPPSPSLCPLSLASAMQVAMDQKGIKREGGGQKSLGGTSMTDMVEAEQKRKNYTREAGEGKRNQSSLAEWRQWEILKHITWMWSLFCVCVCSGLREPSVWDREDRQKATGQVSCPGPWLGQTGSWIWAYQPGWSFGFWLSGGPSYTWVVLRYSQCQELTVSKCVHEPI